MMENCKLKQEHKP